MNNKKIIDESIERALLLMKYNSSKTLTENKEDVKPLLKEDVGSVATGSAIAGAGVGAGIGAALPTSMAVSAAGTGAVGTGAASGLVYGLAGYLGVGAATAGAIVGGAAALAVVPIAYWFIRKDTGAAASVKALFQMCSANPGITKLKRKISDSEIRNLSDKIYDAVNYSTMGFMAGTDEESLYDAFTAVGQGTASDVCALYNYYTRTRTELYEDLDSDIDSPDEWEQIYRPLRNCVEDSLRELEKENPCKEGETLDPATKKCVPIPAPNPDEDKKRTGKSKYIVCNNFPYALYCKSDDIRKVQGCLNVTTDGALGPNTKASIEKAGYSVPLTKSDFDKIMANCGKSNVDNTNKETDPFAGEKSLEIETGETPTAPTPESPAEG